MFKGRTAIIIKVVAGVILISLSFSQKILAANVIIGMNDRFQKQSRSVGDTGGDYQKLAYRIVFDQSYTLTKIGFWPYNWPPSGAYAVYFVSDAGGSPNLSDILTSNTSFNPVDYPVFTGGHTKVEIPIPSYTVQANTAYWIVFNQAVSDANITYFSLGQSPLNNFDFNYTTKYWDGSNWLDTGFYGVIWVKTDVGEIYGQLKLRREGFVGTAGSRYYGQEIPLTKTENYTLDSFNFWIGTNGGSPEDDLYLTIQNLDTGVIIWSGKVLDKTALSSSNDNVYNFTLPKPVISNTSKIRIFVSSPGSSGGVHSYLTNGIEFYDSIHSWGSNNSYAVSSSDNGNTWNTWSNDDLQANLVAHSSSNIPVVGLDNDANQFWVRSDGNDLASGQNNLPAAQDPINGAWKTIGQAAGMLTFGQTVRVQAGNYGNEVITVVNSGNANAPIIFKAEGEVILEDNYTSNKAFSMNGKSYITIDGFTIKKYVVGIWYENCAGVKILNNKISESWGSGGCGIVNRYSNNTFIENNTVYNSGKYNIYIYKSSNVTLKNNLVYNDWSIAQTNPDTTSDYGYKYDYVTDSYSENNIAYNSGWHGWRLRHSCFNNTFKGDQSYNNGGYGFEINENNDNNTFTDCLDDGNNPNYPPHVSAVGIGRGFAVYDKSDNNTFSNCAVKNEDKGYDVRAAWYDEGEWGYNVCTDENTGAYLGGVCNYESRNNKFINCSAENVNYGFRMYSPANIMEKNIVRGAKKNDYHIEIGPDTEIVDPLQDTFTVKLSSPISSLNIKFTNNKVFQLTPQQNVTYQPTQSSVQLNGVTASLTVKTYPMTAIPATVKATATVNKFDTTLTKGSVLIDFTVDTANGNNVDFVVGGLKTDTNYQITRAGANYHVVKSNANKCIAFSNSEWSAKTFTVTETDAAADLITPPDVNIGGTNPSPQITAYSPINLSPSQDEGTTNSFSVIISQPVTNKWYLDNIQQAETSQSFTRTWFYTDSGRHTISYTGTNANGSVSQSWNVTVNDAAKDISQADEQKIKVYPNPYIKGKSPSEKITFANLPAGAIIKIYSSNGKLVKELSAGDGDKAEWSVSGVNSGIYLYAVISSEKTSRGKISVIK